MKAKILINFDRLFHSCICYRVCLFYWWCRNSENAVSSGACPNANNSYSWAGLKPKARALLHVSSVSHYLLPLRVQINRKLELWTESNLELRLYGDDRVSMILYLLTSNCLRAFLTIELPHCEFCVFDFVFNYNCSSFIGLLAFQAATTLIYW